MNQVEKEMMKALKEGTVLVKGNTMVRQGSVYLNGEKIITKLIGGYEVNLNAEPRHTNLSRLKALGVKTLKIKGDTYAEMTQDRLQKLSPGTNYRVNTEGKLV